MYTESSSPRIKGDMARLETPAINLTGPVYIRFYAHMYGSSIGRLKVLARSSEAETEIISLSGNKGNRWFPVYAETTFNSPTTVNVYCFNDTRYTKTFLTCNFRIFDDFDRCTSNLSTGEISVRYPKKFYKKMTKKTFVY